MSILSSIFSSQQPNEPPKYNEDEALGDDEDVTDDCLERQNEVSFDISSAEKEVVIKSFDCPITLCQLKDPVVDECGHTFEREAIMQIYKNSVAARVPFRCPLDRNKILDVNKIVKNYTVASSQIEAAELANKHIKLAKEHSKIDNECTKAFKIIQNLVEQHQMENAKQQKLRQKHEALIQEHEARMQKKDEENKANILKSQTEMQKLTDEFKPLAGDVEEALGLSRDILGEYYKVSALEKGRANVQSASFLDKAYMLMDSKYIDAIFKRNLTPSEQKALEKPAISSDKIQKHERDLDSVEAKIANYKKQERESRRPIAN